MNGQAGHAALTVLFGALAGGLTNSLAIWMLFHPYESPTLFGQRLRRLQGAIPKNKARLAAAIGRTVGTRLLTPEDLAHTVAEPSFRTAFGDRLARFLAALLGEERGSLAEELPPPLVEELRGLLDEAAAALLGRVDAYLAGEEFRAAATRWAEALAAELSEQPLAALLTPEREAALAEAAERWIAEAVAAPAFEQAVRDYLDRAAARLLAPGRTFEQLLPHGLVAALERGVAGYLPLALERLGGMLDEPAARERLKHVLDGILDRLLRDLNFYQRVVAVLLIPADTVDRVLRAIEEEGADRLAELLRDEAVRDAMARKVNDAIVDFLRRPVAAVLGEPGEPPVADAKATVAGWALAIARDAQTRAFLVEKLQVTLHTIEDRTWADLFRHLPPGRVAEAAVLAARSERARALYREAAGRLAAAALERRIGRPADHLPANAVPRLQAALAEPLWQWLQEQVPSIAQRVDIAGRIEQKILDYPMEKVEELIRGLTERELRLIVRLGYVLGGLIGAGLVTLSALLS
ncbi:MAG: DUF445 family protein [Gemmatimonadetes bacterium]|nr:DUF445 family protein [Gemmatimonadota bacterium]